MTAFRFGDFSLSKRNDLPTNYLFHFSLSTIRAYFPLKTDSSPPINSIQKYERLFGVKSHLPLMYFVENLQVINNYIFQF